MESARDHSYLHQVESAASTYAGKPEDLLLALHDVQGLRNYLPREALQVVAHVLQLPESRVCSVVGFYSMFSTTPRGRHIVRVCTSTSCRVSGAKDVVDSLLRELDLEMGGTTADGAFTVEASSCLGLCDIAPAMMVDSEVYGDLVPSDVRRILDAYITGNQSALPPRSRGVRMGAAASAPGQTRVVLENVGFVDPKNIGAYITRGGYSALRSAVAAMSPSMVVDIVKRSGLRGRGGAAFPTGAKLAFAAGAAAGQKYVVCNADEGEPGTFKDRAIMEGDPHKVIEGMAIMAYAVGASKGYVYIRGEYPLSIEYIEEAILQARKAGFLGSGLFGTAFSFDVEIKKGAGAYVCGEETALLESIEGKRGEPRQKPPYPGVSGLWGKPTVVCNVETIANVPPILLRGADWFRGIGAPSSPGTKVFALSGDVRNRGLVEVPMGVTLRELVYGVGGGIPGDRALKAIQAGGASGGCLTPDHLNLTLDYDSLQPAGSSLGSGALLVMDDSHCMVDIICSILGFFAHESCGQCTPCREGAARLMHTFDRLRQFQATADELELAMEVAQVMRASSLCALGQSPIVPLESIMRHFGDEVRGHLNGICDTGTCVPAEGMVTADV